MPHAHITRRIATVSVALAVVGAAIIAPQAAVAAPATQPAPNSYTALGAFSGTVPAGMCAVSAEVLGGAGGKAQAIAASNGAGARITASFDVVAGQAYSGSVGGGGASVQTAGVNGGGRGGISTSNTHPGAGGGGYSDFLLGSSLAILAGGGGGSSGGHTASTEGFGGNAGLPGAGGVSAAGVAGTDGRDAPVSIVVGGGAGGTGTTAGAGGVHSTTPDRNATAGTGRTGGNGGNDSNADTGGGGGGGLFGGGGGASTLDEGAGGNITGGGGGGGSSFVDPSATTITSVTGPKLGGSAQAAGTPGSVTLTWIGCDYDLSVEKTVSNPTSLIGSTITWTVVVTNLGSQAMTQGDTVTLADSLPGAGSKTITALSVSGGSNSALERGAMTCSAVVGDPMPASLECSRPFQPIGGAVDGVRGLDVGESLTISYEQVAAGAVGAVLENQATVTDRTPGDTNDTSTVTTTLVADPPTAEDDSDLDNVLGTSVPVSVLGNDSGSIVDSSLTLFDPVTNTAITSPLVVPGEGTWTVETGGVVRFTPVAGFLTDPTPVTYRVTDSNGLTDTATVTVTYVPEAVDDQDLGNMLGSTVVVDVLANDKGDLDPASVGIVDPSTGDPVSVLVVASEGTWTVDPATGSITFVPLAGFTGNPTPISYEVTDSTGDTVDAQVTITYLPEATDDIRTGFAEGTPVTVDVIGNDAGDFDPTSVVLVDPSNGSLVTTLVVPGEGTWTVDAVTGSITFTPLASFTGDPTPVEYEVTDSAGNVTSALVTITYLHPAAAPEGLVITGADLEVPLLVTGGLLLVGFALMLVARRRRLAE